MKFVFVGLQMSCQHTTWLCADGEAGKAKVSVVGAQLSSQIKLMLGMLSLPPWNLFPLSVQYMSSAHALTAARKFWVCQQCQVLCQVHALCGLPSAAAISSGCSPP
jgi:hypothetical protein